MSLFKISRLSLPILMGLLAAPLHAQLPERFQNYPLATPGETGEFVAPMFNGWIRNEDRSITMIFGFANRNRTAVIDVPLGPNNKIEPAQFQGAQPTHFPVYKRRGFVGIQERGAFAVTVPPDMADIDVVWTLTSGGNTWSIPGNAGSAAYEMSAAEMASGSLKPAIRFDMDGPESVDPVGIYAERKFVSVGEPLTLSAHIQDRGVRDQYSGNDRLYYPLGTYWVMHQGPAAPEIEIGEMRGRDRADEYTGDPNSNEWTEVSNQLTFPEPGEYIIRLRVDNFEAPDSQFDNVCCWSNAYFPVTVNP
ncbi:MAG: hypothetical protein HKP41_00760 [Desulfobacterales bacterium]|nr:hypothetical protein [Desulfobacterales bacterium]